ncbi:MAG: hypothetical protein H6Q69_1812 [Firmicutes bacterium]|nr:hypothetical protein [Bacillota bacterium]
MPDSASTEIIIPQINEKESTELDLKTYLQIGEENHLWRSEPEFGEVVMVGECKSDVGSGWNSVVQNLINCI